MPPLARVSLFDPAAVEGDLPLIARDYEADDVDFSDRALVERTKRIALAKGLDPAMLMRASARVERFDLDVLEVGEEDEIVEEPVGEDAVPWAAIDPGIRPVVQALAAAGFRTIESCQGHGEEDAYVVVLPTRGSTPGATAEKLEDLLTVERWLDNAVISIEWTTRHDDQGTHRRTWIKVRWWGKVPYRG